MNAHNFELWRNSGYTLWPSPLADTERRSGIGDAAHTACPCRPGSPTHEHTRGAARRGYLSAPTVSCTDRFRRHRGARARHGSGGIAERAQKLFPRYARLDSLYNNTGIEPRYSVEPKEWYLPPHTWEERTRSSRARARPARAGGEASGGRGRPRLCATSTPSSSTRSPGSRSRASTRG